MKFTYLDKPLKVFGIPKFDERKILERLPEYVRKAVPKIDFLGRRPTGARLCFRTDADNFTVRLQFETMSVDVGMSIYSCQSAFVYVGERATSRFAGIVGPKSYNQLECEQAFEKSAEMEDVTIFLPRNEVLKNVEIELPDTATVLEPTPYKYSIPVLFYGSSITEGGCCCNVSNAYSAILSRRLDFDYINLGFSGNARGETPVADFINELDISCFVYDYDHNAPDVEHLKNTHYPFYRRIRDRKPRLPILMMTRPKGVYTDEERERREVVLATFERAKAEGDANVYFLDGETFFENDAELCLIDGIHPNDLGFYKMALAIEPTLKQILSESNF